MEDCIGRCEEEKEGHEEERMERTLVLEMMLQNVRENESVNVKQINCILQCT